MRSLVVIIAAIAMGCGTAMVPGDAGNDASRDAGHDAGNDGGSDAGSDANDLDAGSDANDLDATTLDAPDANDLDAGPDAFVPIDIGPFDSGIARTADPPTHPSATPIAPFTECTVTTFTDTISGAEHRTPCEDIPYPNYPPAGGPHYSIWASFLTYDTPVPWPFLVHDLEHGAVVFAYHCANDADCDPIRAELASIIADMGVDPVCRMESTNTRFIVVPDPNLPVPLAAVAWQHLYEATCLDPTSLRAFVAAHYGMGSESLCIEGIDGRDGGWCP